MAVIASTGKERSWFAAVNRVVASCWYGTTNNAEQAPLALNNENILAVNAAGTGTVGLIKADGSDVVTIGNNAVIATPATGTGGIVTTTGTQTLTNKTLTAPVVSVLTDSASVNRIVVNATAKTIVDGSATSLFDVACGASALVGGMIFYHVQASDGTDFQAMSGMVSYSAVNKAASITLTITNATANDAKAVSAGTITLSWTFVGGTNKGTVKLQPTGSLTESTPYTVTYTVFPISGAVTIL